MKRIMKGMALATVIGATLFSSEVHAQKLKTPAPSPTQTVKQAFALSEINLEYSRPGVKNRVVFGDLVPWGKVWRTGANASTKFTFGEDVKVEGKDLKAGTYALYTIPNKDSWEIIFYKDLDLGGNVAAFNKKDEVLHFTVKSAALNDFVETFLINFEDIRPNSLEVQLLWEKTKVSFHITANIDDQIMKNIDEVMSKDNPPYFQAAGYYYENNKDLSKALDWVNKAVDQNPKAYYMIALKAKIQLKQKDFKGAAQTAQQVIDVAAKGKSDDYVAIGKKLLAEAQGK